MALLILAAVLEPDDVVEIVVTGRLRGLGAAAALVGSKVVLVNERAWKPDVVVIPVGNDLQVQGWQDDRSATLTFKDLDYHEAVERIPDRMLAIEFAQRTRDRIAQLAAQPSGGYPTTPEPGVVPPGPPQPGAV